MALATGTIADLSADELKHDVSYYWEVKRDKFSFEYIVYPKDSSKLLVLMPSALGPIETMLPCFYRRSWAHNIPTNICLVSDPTHQLSPEIRGGFFQGDGSSFLLTDVVDDIQALAHKLGVADDRIIFWGSSLGGWSGLMASAILKNSAALAENPQTDLRDYLSGPMSDLNKHVFSEKITEFFEKYPDRFDVMTMFEKARFVPRFWISQSLSDQYHYTKHFLPFMEKIGASELEKQCAIFEPIGSRSDGRGHLSLNYEQGMTRINALNSLLER